MKTMTCKQLGGACDLKFHANTFEEIAEMSKNHGTEMFQNGDSVAIEDRFRGRIFILYGKIKKVECQRKDCSGTQYSGLGEWGGNLQYLAMIGNLQN